MSAPRALLAAAVAGAVALIGVALGAAAANVPGPPGAVAERTPRYAWPVHGPVLRGFEAPGSPYGPGHRGIDIGAPPGIAVRAAERGIVAFAGRVAGSRYVSIDHPDGIRTTYSWLSAVGVDAGTPVARGEVIGWSGRGHPDAPSPHLHFGARVGETYLDPLLILGSQGGVVHLAPLPPADPGPHP